MKVAIVVGGWHWPMDFYWEMAQQASGADLFVIAHRDPSLAIVREEKREILEKATGPLADLDRKLYAEFPYVTELRIAGWQYQEEPNTVGDWGFFNQWLATHDYRQYDVILNCHDDTYLRESDLFEQLRSKRYGDWLILANSRYPEAPEGYVRGSFEFWKREMLDRLGGHIDLGHVGLTRIGKTDSPTDIRALSSWNDTCLPLRDFMVRQGIFNRIGYLSPHYRISPFVIEGERGFLHFQGGAPWSFEAGLKAFPVEVMA